VGSHMGKDIRQNRGQGRQTISSRDFPAGCSQKIWSSHLRSREGAEQLSVAGPQQLRVADRSPWRAASAVLVPKMDYRGSSPWLVLMSAGPHDRGKCDTLAVVIATHLLLKTLRRILVLKREVVTVVGVLLCGGSAENLWGRGCRWEDRGDGYQLSPTKSFRAQFALCAFALRLSESV
jgi:hypothetical protein